MSQGKRKRVRFRGKMRTVAEIARILRVRPGTVHSRLHYGRPLDAPKRRSKHQKRGTPMVDDSVRYAQDIECRVARLVCGGTCTQPELGKLWNFSHQYIDRIEKAAMQKIRDMAAFSEDARELLSYLDSLRGDTFADRMDRNSIGAHEDFSAGYRRCA